MVSLKIESYLLTLSLLHVGGGEGRYAFEETIVVHRSGSSIEPFIPATTIKGVLRTAACIVSSYVGATCCWTKEPREMEYVHKQILGRVCDVCRVWGLPHKEGLLSVSDFRFVGPVPARDAIIKLVHIEIEDKLSTVRKGSLYSMDYVIPGILFKGIVELDAKKGIDVLLLLASMYIAEMVGLGRGGMARFYISKAWVEGRSIAEGEEMAQIARSFSDMDEQKLRLTNKIFNLLKMPSKVDLYKEYEPRRWPL